MVNRTAISVTIPGILSEYVRNAGHLSRECILEGRMIVYQARIGSSQQLRDEFRAVFHTLVSCRMT